ncbi:hypothetical protein ACNSOP_09130 [Aliarcobacter lanthieri]|uniref:hypothetical protein n=1 Tax=Aliarcobacter lanthieri TaxID=1355374 RepID=UPI003AAF82AF
MVDRFKRLQKIVSSEQNKAIAKAYYKDKPIEFINDWVMTYDPRLPNEKIIPFKLFDKQKEFIQFIEDRFDNKENGLCEKSRDSGMSWLAVAWSIHKWLYVDGFSAGFGSRKADFVDNLGDPSSILQKGRMLIEYLPKFFLPKGFRADKHLGYMKFINPENGATITGESGSNIGRGGRTSIYFKDESAFYERPELIEASLTANTDVQIDISTPNGLGNPFHQKAVGGKIKKFRYHWTDDPRKNEEWKSKKINETNEIIFAQEYDIDYSASLPNITISNSSVISAINLNIEDSGSIVAGLDIADDGEDKNAIVIRKGSKVFFIDEWSGIDVSQTTIKALEYCREYKATILNYDSIGVGAGVKGTLNLIGHDGILTNAISTAETPTDGKYGEKTKKDTFRNLRAELWWLMRDRFKATQSYKKNKDVNIDDVISIPNNNQLISELSQPLYFFTENGKIQIESKKDMRKRGIKSPNIADALMLCFYIPKKTKSTLLSKRIKR